MVFRVKLSDDNFRRLQRAYVTCVAPSRFYRLTPVEARAVLAELTAACDEADRLDAQIESERKDGGA